MGDWEKKNKNWRITQSKWRTLIHLFVAAIFIFSMLIFINRLSFYYFNQRAHKEIGELIQEIETCKKILVVIRTSEESLGDPYTLIYKDSEHILDSHESKNKIAALLKEIHFTACRKMENLKTIDRIVLIIFSAETVRTINIWGDSYLYFDNIDIFVNNLDIFESIEKIAEK